MILVLDVVAQHIHHDGRVLVRMLTGLHKLTLAHPLEDGNETLCGLWRHVLHVLQRWRVREMASVHSAWDHHIHQPVSAPRRSNDTYRRHVHHGIEQVGVQSPDEEIIREHQVTHYQSQKVRMVAWGVGTPESVCEGTGTHQLGR